MSRRRITIAVGAVAATGAGLALCAYSWLRSIQVRNDMKQGYW